MFKITADISDIFSSIQGEGIFLGARQIFIRFGRCNLNCAYCDEPRHRPFTQHSPATLLGQVKFLELSKGPHHSVSITGGEPLLYAEFLKVFLPMIRKEHIKVYLETNGTLPEELTSIIGLVDIVAMDIKLPSSTGERAYWKEHFEFLRIATAKKVFLKAVVTPMTTKEDMEKAVDLVKRIKRDIPLVLQPATPVNKDDEPVSHDRMLKLMEIGFGKKFDNIRVIPQVHKILGVK